MAGGWSRPVTKLHLQQPRSKEAGERGQTRCLRSSPSRSRSAATGGRRGRLSSTGLVRIAQVIIYLFKKIKKRVFFCLFVKKKKLVFVSSQSSPACSRERRGSEERRCMGPRRCTMMKTQWQSFLSTRSAPPPASLYLQCARCYINQFFFFAEETCRDGGGRGNREPNRSSAQHRAGTYELNIY